MSKASEQTSDSASNKRALGGWIASGWLFFFAVFFAAWYLAPDVSSAGATVAGRLIFAGAHVFCASLLLFLGFLAVGATRWQLETSDAMVNPALSGGRAEATSVHNRVHTQFLSNTTEQFVMFAAATLAASLFLVPAYLRLITVVTTLWIAGRFFFWFGYWYTAARNQPTYPRAVGLGMGLLCTLAMAGVAVVGICLHFPSFAAIGEPAAAIAATTSFSFSDLLIQSPSGASGSNLLPVVFFSAIAAIVAALAFFPRLAPPVIPIAVLTVVGWLSALLSGLVPLR